jgi:RNA recognition motif-containing protein
MTIYVGNLSYSAEESDIRELFSNHGQVKSVSVPVDKMTGRKKGFCFVDYDAESDEDGAIKALDGHEVDGRAIRVSKANSSGPRTGGDSGDERPRRSFNNRGGFGRGERGSSYGGGGSFGGERRSSGGSRFGGSGGSSSGSRFGGSGSSGGSRFGGSGGSSSRRSSGSSNGSSFGGNRRPTNNDY